MSALRTVRKAIIFVVGVTVCLIGIALLVLPGPAFVVIPAGLAILAIEFVWAKKLLEKVKAGGESGWRTFKALFQKSPPPPPPH